MDAGTPEQRPPRSGRARPAHRAPDVPAPRSDPSEESWIDALERDRPPIGEEPVILGLSRRSHSRLGSRLFTLFFVFVFGLIIVQMFVALLAP